VIDVVCVGILVADLMAKPVDSVPKPGLLSLVDSIEIFTGGNSMTAAINIKKLGLESAMVGSVGKDFLGDILYSELEKVGVITEGVYRNEAAQTSASIVLSSSGGERTFMHCMGANAEFSSEQVNWDIVKQANVVFLSGTFLMKTFDGVQTAEFLKECKRLGKTTALDVCWDSQGQWGSLLDQAMPYIDIFMPSIEEARMLSGANEKSGITQIADCFFKKGVGSVVIKLGKDGCFIREKEADKGEVISTFEKVTVVDTTGAGDSFCSGFLTAFVKGKSFAECAKFANAVGSCCVSAKGATTGIKSYEQTLKFMEDM